VYAILGQETDPGHIILLVRSGIYIIENLFLEEPG
jgi:hypothetical protein